MSLNTSSNSHFTGNPTPDAGSPKRIDIPEAWDEYLFRMTGALGAGHLELWQLPKSLHWLWTCAWFAGRASRDDEVARLNFEADYWYFRHANPRLSWHRHAESELWREAA